MEHEIELLFSSSNNTNTHTKMKATTTHGSCRVYWNKLHIGTIPGETKYITISTSSYENTTASESTAPPVGPVFSWTTPSGKTIQIRRQSAAAVAAVDAVEPWELWVDEEPFSKFPVAGELGVRRHDNDASQALPTAAAGNTRNKDEKNRPLQRLSSAKEKGAVPFYLSDERDYDTDLEQQRHNTAIDSLGFRLSMAGLSPSSSCSNITEQQQQRHQHNHGKSNRHLYKFVEPEENPSLHSLVCQDELHSELYSPVEALRNQLTRVLPQIEEMVSRAIIQAFFGGDCDTLSMNSFDETDPHQLEVDLVSDAWLWWQKVNGLSSTATAAANKNYSGGGADDSATMRYIQKRLDDIFSRVRNEDLNAEAATRIVLSLAAVLGLTFAENMTNDTFLLHGLPVGTSVDDLRLTLIGLGIGDSATAVSISQTTPSFVLCRFSREVHLMEIDKILDPNRRVFGDTTSAFILEDNRFTYFDLGLRLISRDAISEQQLLDDSGDDSTCVAVPPPIDSPQQQHHQCHDSPGSVGFAVFLDSTQYTWSPMSS